MIFRCSGLEEKDWYANEDEVNTGDIFIDREGCIVKIERELERENEQDAMVYKYQLWESGEFVYFGGDLSSKELHFKVVGHE